MTVRFPLLAALCVLLLAGCGESPTATTSEGRETSPELTEAMDAVESLDAGARREKLLELAREEEGPISFYATLNIELLEPLAERFQEQTGLEVEVFETNSEGIIARIDQESRAGVAKVDVVETGGPEMYTMNDDGVFADVDTPLAQALGEGADQDGWVTTRFNQYVVGWNTENVDGDEAPRSWEELADARWKGRIAVDGGLGGVFVYKTLTDHWLDQGRSQAEIDETFKGIASNAAITPGLSLTTELVGAGEYDVAAGATSIGHIQRARRADASITYEPIVEPIVRLRMGAGVARDAPHPAGALLFLDFLLGEGQEIYGELQFDPAREDLQSAAGAEEAEVDLDELIASQGELSDQWDSLTRLGEVVEEEPE